MHKAGLQERVAAPAAAVQRRGQGLAVPGIPPIQAQRDDDQQAAQMARFSAQLHAGPAMAAQRKLADGLAGGGGLPGPLKSGIENLSGIAMDGVQVHYNSPRPAQLNAHAFAQGSDIHLGPGQEQHLPHEAWHVAQQAQGRVAPTMQMAGVPVNDDGGLEAEADAMGAQALQMHAAPARALAAPAGAGPVQRKVNFSGFRDHHYLPEIFEKIRAAFAETSDRLRPLMPAAFDELAAKIDNQTELVGLIVKLNLSAIDFGDINLDNPQHAIQLFLDFKKYLTPAYGKPASKQAEARAADEGTAKDQAIEKQAEWQREKDRKAEALSTEPSGASVGSSGLERKSEAGPRPMIYQTALLGAGASIAYYLNANGRGLDTKKHDIDRPAAALADARSRQPRHRLHQPSDAYDFTAAGKIRPGRSRDFRGQCADIIGPDRNRHRSLHPPRKPCGGQCDQRQPRRRWVV
jgi:hypothetical protein